VSFLIPSCGPGSSKSEIAKRIVHGTSNTIVILAVGTQARLALDLMLYTGVRRSDAVRLGREHGDRDGWLVFEQAKTGGLVEIPIIPRLAETLAAGPIGAKLFLRLPPATPSPRPASAICFGDDAIKPDSRNAGYMGSARSRARGSRSSMSLIEGSWP
jgi:integrase